MSQRDGTQNGNTDSHSQPIDLYWDLFRKVCVYLTLRGDMCQQMIS